MPATARGFELTNERILLNVWISVGAAAACCLLCLFVLGAAAWIRSKPQARHAIDRVSFRLLLWSMVFEVFYDIAFIAVGVESAVTGASQAACATGVYFMVSTLAVVNYLCTCIAVNLMLIVCFKVNPIEQRLERWYVGVSVFVGMVIPIGPAIKQHFGFDPVLNVCWIQAKSDKERLLYFMVDLYLWQIISCIIATVAVAITLVTLFRQRLRMTAAPDDKKADVEAEQLQNRWSLLQQLQTRYLKIAILISLYPISLILVNGVITVGDLYISAKGGVDTRGAYGLYCIYYFLYGGRGTVFACLGIFVDPCLRTGLRLALRGDTTTSNLPPAHDPREKASLIDFLIAPGPHLDYDHDLILDDDTTKPTDRNRQASKVSIEMQAALSRLPMETEGSRSVPLSRKLPLPERTYSRTFSGVQAEALPFGLTDDVDVDMRLNAPQGGLAHHEQWLKSEGPTALESIVDLDPLEPDLPDAVEAESRRQKAEQVDRERAIKDFRDTQAQL